MTTRYLVAHLIYATSLECAEIEFEVAFLTKDNTWLNNDGLHLWPFWKINFDDLAHGFIWEDVKIPDGWIEKLKAEADHYATQTAVKAPTLLSRLNLHRTQPPIIRRI